MEVFHEQLNSFKLFVDSKLTDEGPCQGSISFQIEPSSNRIEVWIHPWKIQPKVRINHILVDNAVAGFDQYDHKIDLTLDRDFFRTYQQREITFQVASIFGKNPPDADAYDRVIGHDAFHRDLVEKIRRNLGV